MNRPWFRRHLERLLWVESGDLRPAAIEPEQAFATASCWPCKPLFLPVNHTGLQVKKVVYILHPPGTFQLGFLGLPEFISSTYFANAI